jgi:alpha-beta hydrolase superfamily lysophospholipase
METTLSDGPSTFTLSHLDVEDGVKLAVYTWPAPGGQSGQPKAAVQITHGLAEHAGRYDRLARALTAAGYQVYASDHRGHGKTARDASELGFLAAKDGFRKVVDDLYAVNRYIAARHDKLPRVLLGHSFGSFAAQDFLFSHGDNVSAVALSGSTSNIPVLPVAGLGVAHLERLRVGPRGTSKLLQTLSFGAYNKAFAPNRTDFDWLSRDPKEVDKYIADPLCGFDATVQAWIDLFGELLRIASPDHQKRIPKQLPIYVFSGTLDPVGDAGKGTFRLLKQYEKAGLERVTSRLYAGARHELFNETNRDEVTADLVRWLDSVFVK